MVISENKVHNAPSSSITDSSEEKKATVLVTGATGLVGSHLIKQLSQSRVQVKALYRKEVPFETNKEKVEWVRGDILDVGLLEENLSNVDFVYHCAGMVSYHSKDREQLFKTNVEGTSNVVNACLNAGVQKLCFVSSIAALGKKLKGNEIDETATWTDGAGVSNYAKSKYLAEMEVWRGIGEGLGSVIVNPSVILGAGSWHEGSTKIFKTAYKEFPWYSEGVTGFVDVHDVVHAMVLLMNSGVSAQRFIVSAENRTFKHVFSEIAKAFGKKPPSLKVTRTMASLAWRAEAFKSLFTKKTPLITRETARSSLEVGTYNNNKLKHYFPFFEYTDLDVTIKRVCKELLEKISQKQLQV